MEFKRTFIFLFSNAFSASSLLKNLFLLSISFDFSITLISNWSVNISLILHANSMPEGPPPTINNFLCNAVSCDFFKKEFNLFRS